MASGETCSAIRVPGGQLVRLESDLTLEVLSKIAADAGLNLMFILSAPQLGEGSHFAPLYRACCEFAGVEAPARITAKMYFDSLETVDDDLPEEYEDGIPKGETPSTTSS